MSQTPAGCERLREAREGSGLSQSELAAAVGLTRQSINAIETGRNRPGVDVALRIAALLGRSVEELFRVVLPSRLSAEASGSQVMTTGERVALARLDGRWVSYPLKRGLSGQAADGIVRRVRRASAEIEPLCADAAAADNVVVMGCAAALGPLTERLNRRAGQGRYLWVPASSTVALQGLAKRQAHVAGVHLIDPRTGEENLPDVQRESGPGPRAVITLARWEVGLVVQKGNPQRLRSIEQLVRPRGSRRPAPLRLVARERGSGARRLLEQELGRVGASGARLLAQARQVSGHLEVAQAIAMGAADAGLATRDAALAYDLDFIAISEERYDLVLPQAALDDARLQRLLDTLTSAAFRRELTALGYDARPAGTRVADLQAA